MHTVVIDHKDRSTFFRVRCAGADCPLCASTAEDRAKLAFVKPKGR